MALSLGALFSALLMGCGVEAEPLRAAPGEHLSGGEMTVFDTTREAFSRPAPGLTDDVIARFFVGNSYFTENWVAGPASVKTRDGLGPTFNARSCAACHFKDGRGAPPDGPNDTSVQLLIRLSVPGQGPHGAPVGDPNYGGQFNPRSIPGVPSEGSVTVVWEEETGSYDDGETYTLRRPKVSFSDLNFGALSTQVMTSPRVAPAVYGLGLLQAIAAQDIRARADPDDSDNDGISGRVNEVWDVAANRSALGRFGWKANQPGLRQQNASAFLGDVGLTTTLFPGQNCPTVQVACSTALHGGEPEVSDHILDRVTFYTTTLAVPARRDWASPTVLRGKKLFGELGCASCHTPRFITGVDPDFSVVSNQVIWPYTDLLLHDMGEDLADGRPDHQASGQEWRTPPLWGVGLIERVNHHNTLLHDGRARGMAEAILWHGGEAKSSRDGFRALSKAERADLVAFLGSL